MKKANKSFIVWYCAALILIDFMGLAIVVVSFPKLLLSGIHTIFPAAWSYNYRFALMGVLLALFPLGQFFGASVFGKLSDHWGRKNILLITLLGTFVGFFLTAISISRSAIALLFISRLLTGLFAGNVAIAQASMADVSDEATKARNLTLAQAAMGTAWIVGPVLGAFLSSSSVINWFNYSTPFWFFCVIVAILFLLTFFLYEDTLQRKEKVKINMLEGLQQIYGGFMSKTMRSAFLVWLIFVSGWWLFEAFMPAYLFKHFNLDTLEIGRVLAYNGALYAAFQFLVVRKVAKYLQPETMVKSSVCFAALGVISLAFIPKGIALYVSMSVFVLAMGFALPGLITSISNLANRDQQGQVMGSISAIQAISTVLVMIVGGYINVLSNDITVIGGGVLMLVSWLFYWVSFSGKKNAVKNKA